MENKEEWGAQWERKGLALAALGLARDVWREESRGWPLACGPGCAVCCSDRLALTTLEGRALALALERGGRADLLARAASLPVVLSARPAATINTLARLALEREEPPWEPEPPAPGPCPLLLDGLCAAYEDRPLGCRLMVSRQTCRAGGSALADPWWLTLATALHQIVEHLDQGGGYGLLPDVLAASSGGAGEGLLPCRPLPGIPAPPDHQARLQGVLEGLFRRSLEGRPLGWWMRALG